MGGFVQDLDARVGEQSPCNSDTLALPAAQRTALHAHHGWASPPQGLDEIFRRDLGLAENTGKGAYLDFAMHRHHTAFRFALHEDVAPTLTHLLEAKPLKRAQYLDSRNVRQFRHAPARGL